VKRQQWRAAATAMVAAFGLAAAALVSAGPAQAAATTNSAFWSMDEAAGSLSMADSSGAGITGTLGADVLASALFNGATAYRFADISPTLPPARPEHLVQVPENDALDPGTSDYAVTVRYRTTKSYGNVLQKGQNATTGGYWKFEQPNGFMTCLFKGSRAEQRAVTSKTALNDGAWHTVRCERTATGVSMYVDGVFSSQLRGTTGTINNNWELSIGGKSRCDQVKTTCDYFTGDVDYVRIEKGSGGAANQAPVSSLVPSCTGLICNLSGATSTDADGAIQTYAWSFGDGTNAVTGSVATTTHAFAEPGSYPVTLTVTDDRGATHSSTVNVTVEPAAEIISFVGRSVSNGNAVTHTVTVPAAVQAGDGLLLFESQNTHAAVTSLSGDGWSLLQSIDGGYATTRVWRKVAVDGDAGSAVSLGLAAQSKASLTLAAYRGTGADPVAAYTAATDTSSTTVRTTPTATVGTALSWGVSFWVHGDSTSTALTPPSGVTVRASGTQTGGGRVTTLVADSGAGLPAGSYGGLSATGAAASTTTATWTILLAPAG
jgi:PKD domain/Laminin G domain